MQSKWTALAASLPVATLCALNYAFAVFSPLIKTRYGSQHAVNVVGTLGNVGQFASVGAGASYDRFGPRIVLIGGLLSVVGFIMLYALLDDSENPPPLLVTASVFCLASNAQPFFDSAAILTSIHNFDESNRGYVIGIGKTMNGLGGAFWALSFAAFFNDSDAARRKFVLFVAIAVFCTVATFGGALKRTDAISQTDDDDDVSERRRLLTLFKVMVANACAVIAVSYTTKLLNDSRITSALGVLLETCVVGFVVKKSMEFSASGAARVAPNNTEDDDEELIVAQQRRTSSLIHFRGGSDDTSFKARLKDVRVWLVFAVMTVQSGVGLAFMNNLEQISETYTKNANSSTTLVTLLGAGNAFGRLLTGYMLQEIQESADARSKRTIEFLASSVLGCTLSFSLMSTLVPSESHATYVILGVISLSLGTAYGSLWAILPEISHALFSGKSVGSVYSLLSSAPMLGSFVFAQLLTSSVYDSHADANGRCVGNRACFRASFVTCAVSSGLSICFVSGLYWTTSKD